ncbi:MAG: hypothetical protein MJZ25_03665 [Fibrobacter sp.]|nr:hypothetical protein [Fibrobacter sp.]
MPNYQKGTLSGINQSYDTAMKDAEQRKTFNDSQIGYYMNKFYDNARGHLINKYHVGLWGDYVYEALRVMDRNSYADKYTLTNTKQFKQTGDLHINTAFKNWADLFYSKEARVLNMYWNANKVTMGSSTAKPTNLNIDNTKTMMYPLILSDQGPKELKIHVVDDPYMMWYQFFNALYNVQFSPLVLKARSTWQKIVIAVDLYNDATTTTRSDNFKEASKGNQFTTDISLAQMFEFNSCVLTGAPQVNPSYDESNPFSFDVSFMFPNAFQGTCKQQLRYLRDNTNDGCDGNAITTKNGGTYQVSFYEESYSSIKKRGPLYEAFNESDYYKNYSNRYFSSKKV